MNTKFHLEKKQLTLILTNLIVVKMIFAFPRNLFTTSGNAAWIEAIYISVIAFLLLEVSLAFYSKTGKRSVIQLSESIGGIPLKIITAILVVCVLASNLGVEMRTFAESVKLILLPKTRVEYVMILFALSVAFGALCGFGAIATINALFFPFCLFFLATLVVSLIKYYNVNNLLPVFGRGVKNIFVGGLTDLSCFSDIIALNLLLPYCKDIEAVKVSGRRAVIIGGVVITVLCAAYGMVYPYPYSSHFLLTSYQLSRMVRAGEYFQRFEALFEFVWAITQLLYSSIYIYIICNVLTSAFKLRFEGAIIPCVTALIALLAFEPSSVVELLQLSSGLKLYLFPIAYLLPILIPCIYIISGRKKNEK